MATADVLLNVRLCEATFSAVRRDMSEGEVARIEQLHAMHVQQVREKFDNNSWVQRKQLQCLKGVHTTLGGRLKNRMVRDSKINKP